MFYATHDADDGRISQNAHIVAFETAEQAREYLLSPFDGADWNRETVEIGAGRYGDCWVKLHSAPQIEGSRLICGLFDGSPFTADQLAVQAPGQHPGGRAWWIEPTPEVLVVEYIKATGDDC